MLRILSATFGADGHADAERVIERELSTFTRASTALLLAVDEHSAELQ